MKTLIFLGVSLFIGRINMQVLHVPDVKFIWIAFIAILIDLITGMIKAKIGHKETITSWGIKRKGKDVIQYTGIILCGIILNNINNSFEWLGNGVCIYIIYTEVYSIFENLLEINPTGKLAPLFRLLLRIMTLNLEKMLPKVPEEKKDNTPNGGAGVLLLIIASSFILNSCTIVKPGEKSTYTKTDSTTTNYKPVAVEYKGATATTNINYDSLYQIWKKSLPAVEQSKADSLFKVFLKSFKKDTVTVADPQSKAQLKYWYDEFGKLQMSCTAKDQTLSIMVAEITRLTKEVSSSNKTVVVYKMVWWGWVIVGVALLCFLALVSMIIYSIWIDKKR